MMREGQKPVYVAYMKAQLKEIVTKYDPAILWFDGEAIYGTTAGPFKTQLPWGRATSKKGKLYLHVFDWPADGVLNVPGYSAHVTRAYLLVDPKGQLTTEAGADGLRIRVPATAPDPVATVIVLETKS
jgi:alpha-L-fucosidase